MLAFEAADFTWLVKPGEKVKMGQPIGILRHSEEVDELIRPVEDCSITPVFEEEEEEELVSPATPDVLSDDETENIEIETKGNYVLEVVKDLYHAGMKIYRMKSVRN